MGLTCSSRERSIPLATGLEQQAPVADLVPAALYRYQLFNLQAGKVLRVADFQHRPARISVAAWPKVAERLRTAHTSVLANALAEFKDD
jgi:hypothetical protein